MLRKTFQLQKLRFASPHDLLQTQAVSLRKFSSCSHSLFATKVSKTIHTESLKSSKQDKLEFSVDPETLEQIKLRDNRMKKQAKREEVAQNASIAHLEDINNIDEILKPIEELEQQQAPAVTPPQKKADHSHPAPYLVSDFTGELMQLEDYMKIMKEHKASDIAVIDCRTKCLFADYIIFCTGHSFRQMSVLANTVAKELRKRRIDNLKQVHVEGADSDQWMLVDGGNIVFQVFSPEGRAIYDLERKWVFQKIENYEYVYKAKGTLPAELRGKRPDPQETESSMPVTTLEDGTVVAPAPSNTFTKRPVKREKGVTRAGLKKFKKEKKQKEQLSETISDDYDM